MRTQSFGWIIRPAIVVFVFQEIIFVREYIQDINSCIGGPAVGDAREPSPGKFDDVISKQSEVLQDAAKKWSLLNDDVTGQLSRMSQSFIFRERGVNCDRIVRGDERAIALAAPLWKRNITMPSSNFAMVMRLKHSCSKFIYESGYILHHMTEEENNFPIAYSLIVYKHFHQIESMMRLIYRPQNFYCIHVDHSSVTHLHIAARNYADCFPNVFVPRDVVDVGAGFTTSINAEIMCMFELLKHKWKYYISLTGQDYPLKTNREIVQILTALQGANDIHTKSRHLQGLGYKVRFKTKLAPPHGIQLTRGSGEIVVSRAFAEFLTGDYRVRNFLTYLNGTKSPAETFWASVNNDRTLRAPGGFGGNIEEACIKPWIGRLKWQERQPYCRGRFNGDTCVFGVGDLYNITRGRQMFASKFFWDFQPVAFRCMREWMVNRTRDDYLSKRNLDLSYYYSLPQVEMRNRA